LGLYVLIFRFGGLTRMVLLMCFSAILNR